MDPSVWAEVAAAGRDAGLDALGTTSARPWTANRSVLEARRGDGLAGDMAFTYRNPARSTDPTRLLRGATSLAVGLRSHLQDVPAPPEAGVPARVARYATADHYGRLEAALEVVADGLRALGHRAVVVCDDNGLVDREAAWRAGLGWYGRNSLLLHPGAGSWFVIGSVVTDAELPPGSPPVADGCGTCVRCLPACPTGAIVAPGVVDARRCLSWLLQAPGDFPEEHRVALGDRIYGCDDCQEVCPPNRTAARRAAAGPHPPTVEDDPGTWLDVVELLSLDDVQLLERCRRWYVPGRDPSVVRRNLLVVLGNSGRPEAPGVAEALQRHLAWPDPVVASHARWAAERLGGWQAAGDGGNNGPS